MQKLKLKQSAIDFFDKNINENLKDFIEKCA
jgi:hypothetical protein